MKINTENLINKLIQITEKNIKEVQSFKDLTDKELNAKTNGESWSILECIEHLNRYGNFYIPEIRKRMENSNFKKSAMFRSGILGNYFAKSMLPKEKLKKVKTFNSMNPNNSSLDRNVLNEFLHQQESILEFLNKARNIDLTRTKTSISISKWIKLRLGDTLRVVIYHNLRHIVQAKRMIKSPAGNNLM